MATKAHVCFEETRKGAVSFSSWQPQQVQRTRDRAGSRGRHGRKRHPSLLSQGKRGWSWQLRRSQTVREEIQDVRNRQNPSWHAQKGLGSSSREQGEIFSCKDEPYKHRLPVHDEPYKQRHRKEKAVPYLEASGESPLHGKKCEASHGRGEVS